VSKTPPAPPDVSHGIEMVIRKFKFEYWIDDRWFVGRIKEVPGVFSQGATLKELEENIADAYRMVSAEKDEYIP
jgi:predicted RNase H-like HicB family nuclease